MGNFFLFLAKLIVVSVVAGTLVLVGLLAAEIISVIIEVVLAYV